MRNKSMTRNRVSITKERRSLPSTRGKGFAKRGEGFPRKFIQVHLDEINSKLSLVVIFSNSGKSFRNIGSA